MNLTPGVNINGNFVQYALMQISFLGTHISKKLCTKPHKDIPTSTKNLNGYQLLFILKDKHKHISSLEVSFYPYNFLHLTGIKLIDGTTATDFYKRCLNHKLSPEDFSFASDGTTQLKLEILPQLMLKNISAKMVGDFNGCNPKLYTEKLAGGVKACLGFIKTHRAEYVPNTVLNTDIRTVTKISQQVIATYRRKNSASPYQELVYKAKNRQGYHYLSERI